MKKTKRLRPRSNPGHGLTDEEKAARFAAVAAGVGIRLRHRADGPKPSAADSKQAAARLAGLQKRAERVIKRND